jgi:hypothetical protein
MKNYEIGGTGRIWRETSRWNSSRKDITNDIWVQMGMSAVYFLTFSGFHIISGVTIALHIHSRHIYTSEILNDKKYL